MSQFLVKRKRATVSGSYLMEFKKYIYSQQLYAAVRMVVAVLIPCLIFYSQGDLHRFALFPLGTSLVAFSDHPGPYVRRRNSMFLGAILFFFLSFFAGLFQAYPFIIALGFIVFGIPLTMLGIYGIRMAGVGGLSLVVYCFSLDPDMNFREVGKEAALLGMGAMWYVLVYVLLHQVQPYKIAQQLIGENYLLLSQQLRLRAEGYLKEKYNVESEWALQVKIKDAQEAGRDLVFRTRNLVNESTTTSRMLMLLFLKSIDISERILTRPVDKSHIHQYYGGQPILKEIYEYLNKLAQELENIGLYTATGRKGDSHTDYYEAYESLQDFSFSSTIPEKPEYYTRKLESVIAEIGAFRQEIYQIYQVLNQDLLAAKSLSTGLDFDQFVPHQERLNTKVFFQHFSLKSGMFRHSVRLVTALLIGYALWFIPFFRLEHPYWILIAIIAIMRPAFAVTRQRNKERWMGTAIGLAAALFILSLTDNAFILILSWILSMLLSFSFLKNQHLWGIAFMTLYVVLMFDFLFPQNVLSIIQERILDTSVAAGIIFVVSSFVLPSWERDITPRMMQNFVRSVYAYTEDVFQVVQGKKLPIQEYKLKRKNMLVNLGNLSANFQRMLSDIRKDSDEVVLLHKFVNFSHLISAYLSAIAIGAEDFYKNNQQIQVSLWRDHILDQLQHTQDIILSEGGTNALQGIDSNASISGLSSQEEKLVELLSLLNQVIDQQQKVVKEWKESRG